jgi:hypothetical protein
MFDGVHMVRTGCLEEFLEAVFWLPRLALEAALSGCDTIIVGAVHFLVIIVVAGSNCDPLRASLLPLFCHH